MTPSENADTILEMNRWRHGLGKYAKPGAEPPVEPAEWGAVLVESAHQLKGIARARECIVEARERLLAFRGWAEEGDDVMDALGDALEALGGPARKGSKECRDRKAG